MRDVIELHDKEALLPFLLADRVSSAYALGDLDPRYSDFCRWFGSRSNGTLDSVALLYSGLRVPALLTFGDEAGIEVLLDDPALREALPTRFYAHMASAHLGAFQARCSVDGLRAMVRMSISRGAFSATPEEEPADAAVIVPVGHADTGALMGLYRYYPDNFFEPYQLESGFYFGVRSGKELVSVAGVHVVAEPYDVAVIGNVVTHPDHRAKGHSRRCTRHLLTKLFDRVSLVTLNVQRDNVIARRVYERLGFAEHFRYLEGTVQFR